MTKPTKEEVEAATGERIESLISFWSMRPSPHSQAGQAWEDGARQGWKWAKQELSTLSPTPSAETGERDERQRIAFDWGKRAFGEEQMSNIIRAARMIEEAAELAQACRLPKDHAQRALDYVYSRPPGDQKQEAGGVGVTLMALCATLGLSADECERIEVERCLSKPIEHFAARNQVKIAAVDSAPSPDAGRVEEGWQLVAVELLKHLLWFIACLPLKGDAHAGRADLIRRLERAMLSASPQPEGDSVQVYTCDDPECRAVHLVLLDEQGRPFAAARLNPA